jgi:hypothetical protein
MSVQSSEMDFPPDNVWKATLWLNFYLLCENLSAVMIKIGAQQMGINTMDMLLFRSVMNGTIAFLICKYRGVTVFTTYKMKHIFIRCLFGDVAVICQVFGI